MELIELIRIPLSEYICSITWRDVIEILFFSSLFYGAIKWLEHDRHQHLLFYFFASSILVFLSYALELTTINSFLSWYMPTIVMLAILIHQRTLQKNFVSLRTQPLIPTTANHLWIDDLMRIMLRAMSKNKPITCIIERNDKLDNLVTTELAISCQLTMNHLSSLEESSLFQHQKMMWITQDGMLRGLNSNVNHHDHLQKNNEDTLYFDALLLSSTTDALVIMSNLQTNTFTLMSQGKVASSLHAPRAQHIINSIINPHTKEGNVSYAEFIRNSTHASQQSDL